MTAALPAATSSGELRGTVQAALAGLAVPGEPCALLDRPNHANVGDSAIWIGAKQALARRDARVAYTSDSGTFDAAKLRHAVGGGTVFITGGGNLGDLWPEHQAFREHVLRLLPDNPVVQLPQSIFFAHEAARARAAAAFASHSSFTLMVRDRESAETASTELGIEAQLAPDIAFALEASPRRGRTDNRVLWLSRADDESPVGAATRHEAVRVVDWAIEETSISPLGRVQRRLEAMRPTDADRVQEARAAARLLHGYSLLSAAEVIVTERLHGHILACILGRPHIVIDTLQGKARAFHDTWTHGLGLAEFAVDRAHALELALERIAKAAP